MVLYKVKTKLDKKTDLTKNLDVKNGERLAIVNPAR